MPSEVYPYVCPTAFSGLRLRTFFQMGPEENEVSLASYEDDSDFGAGKIGPKRLDFDRASELDQKG